MRRVLCLAMLIAFVGITHADKSATTEKCLTLKKKSERLKCLNDLSASKPGEWFFSEVTQSPMNDALSVYATFSGDRSRHEMRIGCYEGEMSVTFRIGIYLSTMHRYYYPIAYRLDKEDPFDCTTDDMELFERCLPWQLSKDGYAFGIWGEHQTDPLIAQWKDAKRLTIRAGNMTEDRTAQFDLKDFEKTYRKVKKLCGKPEETQATEPGASP